MSVIEGASVSVKTMSDGTLRLAIDIEPRNAQAAFALFGSPGRAVALAALVDGHARASDTSPEPVAEEPKKEREHLGDLCYRAVMWCNDPEFQQWIRSAAKISHLPPSDELAKSIIVGWCQVKSRKDLDTIPDAGRAFREQVMGPYRKHLQARGLV